jgi:hypothetical protein
MLFRTVLSAFHQDMGMAEWVLPTRPSRSKFVSTCDRAGRSSAEYVHTEELYFYQYNTAHCFENHSHSFGQNRI